MRYCPECLREMPSNIWALDEYDKDAVCKRCHDEDEQLNKGRDDE